MTNPLSWGFIDTITSWRFAAVLLFLVFVFSLPVLFNPHRTWLRHDRAAGWLDLSQPHRRPGYDMYLEKRDRGEWQAGDRARRAGLGYPLRAGVLALRAHRP